MATWDEDEAMLRRIAEQGREAEAAKVTTPHGVEVSVLDGPPHMGEGVLLSMRADTPTSQKRIELFLSPENCSDLSYLLDKWRHKHNVSKLSSTT